MKKFIIGLIIGAMVCSILPAGAAIQQYILTKYQYKVQVNGKDYSDISLPVLSYKGTIYAPVKKVCELAGATYKVVSNVKKEGESKVSEEKQLPPVIKGQTPPMDSDMMRDYLSKYKEKLTPDGLIVFLGDDGKEYIAVDNFNQKYKDLYYIYSDHDLNENRDEFIRVFRFIKFDSNKKSNMLMDKMEVNTSFTNYYILYDYYVSTILPLIK